MATNPGSSEAERRKHLLQLASAIKDAVVKIESISAENDLPVPSFDEDAVYHVSEKVSQEVDIVLDATAELHDLFSGPRDLVHRHCGVSVVVVLQSHRRVDIAPLMMPAV